jgi:hypothetical protein
MTNQLNRGKKAPPYVLFRVKADAMGFLKNRRINSD